MCKVDTQMKCSTCKSQHLTSCSFHTLHALDLVTLVFNFQTWSLFMSIILYLRCVFDQIFVSILKATIVAEKDQGKLGSQKW
jgi:hypothetical protein